MQLRNLAAMEQPYPLARRFVIVALCNALPVNPAFMLNYINHIVVHALTAHLQPTQIQLTDNIQGELEWSSETKRRLNTMQRDLSTVSSCDLRQYLVSKLHAMYQRQNNNAVASLASQIQQTQDPTQLRALLHNLSNSIANST